MKGAGDKCSCCKVVALIVVRGVVVSPVCDSVGNWPKSLREP